MNIRFAPLTAIHKNRNINNIKINPYTEPSINDKIPHINIIKAKTIEYILITVFFLLIFEFPDKNFIMYIPPRMEQVPSSNEEENVEGQTDIYDFIPEEDDTAGDNEENSMIQEDQEEDIQEHQFTANSNNAPREREMISFIKGNIRSLKRSKEIADEIGYQDSISKELDEIVDRLNEILLSLQSNHSDQ